MAAPTAKKTRNSGFAQLRFLLHGLASSAKNGLHFR
jgi:hypothetical protein